MPKRDPDRDVELDKKIVALRRKNEVLMKRYQEVEEDKKKAEKEGMALQNHKGKVEDLTITINKSTSQDTRVVVTKPGTGGSPSQKGQQEAGLDGAGECPLLTNGRGRRRQLLVTMVGKKGKRVVSERLERRLGPADGRTEDDAQQSGRGKRDTAAQGKRVVSERLERRLGPADGRTEDDAQQSGRGKRDTAAQDELWQVQSAECDSYCQESGQARTDLTIPTSKEEQDGYLLWKKERGEIDRERVARHKNSKGQWRRAWDMDKTENIPLQTLCSLHTGQTGPLTTQSPRFSSNSIVKFADDTVVVGLISNNDEKAYREEVDVLAAFSDKSLPERDRGPPGRGGRNARRGHPRSNTDSQGQETCGKDQVKVVPLVSSKAKGKDRLTGRARRWDGNEGEEHLKASETSLEEFLEELDALTDSEVCDHKDGDLNIKSPSSLDAMRPEEVVSGPGSAPAAPPGVDTLSQAKAEASSPLAHEKKVRFSEELIQEAPARPVTGGQNSLHSDTRGPSSLKASSPRKIKHEVRRPKQAPESVQDHGGGLPDQGDLPAPVAQPQSSSEHRAPPQQPSEAPVVSETESTVKHSVPPAVPNSPPAVPNSPPAVPNSLPAVPNYPPAVPNSPPAVPNSLPAVPNSPPAVPNSPPAVPNSPPAVPNSPPAVPNSPPAVPNSLPAVPNYPPAVPNSPPAVPNSPPAVPNSPPAVPNSPPAVLNSLPAVPNSPPAVLNSLPAVPNSPPAVPNSPPAVPNSPPPAVPNSPPAVPNSPPAVPNSPPAVPNSPPAVPNSLPAVPNSLPAVPNSPPAVPNSLPAVPNPPPAVPNPPPAVPNSPPAVPNSPPAVPNSPPAVSNSPPAVSNSLPAVPNSLPAVPNSLPAVPNSPPAVPNSLPAVSNSLPAVPNSLPAVPNSPPAVPNSPPAVSNSPPAVSNSPPAVPNSPPAVSNSPPAVSNSPPAVPNSPSAVPNSPPAGEACTSLQENCVQPVEHPKSDISNRNTEELIDAGLSVLSLESGATHRTHTTSTDKARENGKIV